jgi:hypothetical protein
MSQLLIGDITSRIRGLIKAVRQDSFLTDRQIYSIFKKHAAMSIKRLDEKKRLTAFASIFETLDFVKLKVIDKVEASACGVGPKSYATMSVTCLPIPVFTEGIYGPMIRSITSLDGSEILKLTTPDEYNYIANSKNFKYNTLKYCWYINDRIYFPNLETEDGLPWPAVRMEAMVEEDISAFKCDYDQKCKPRQCHSLNIPDFIVAEIEGAVLKDLTFMLQAPEDDKHDNVNQLR